MIKRFFAVILIILLMSSLFGITVFAAQGNNKISESASTNVKSSDKSSSNTKNSKVSYYKDYVDKLEQTYYKGNLGATYSKEQTSFKLWAPTAKEVKVCIYKTGSDDEENAEMISENSMKFAKEYGTWYLFLNGDYKNYYYTYKVNIDGKVNEIVDPYAKAAGVNGNRGMIVDLDSTDPKGWNNDSFNRVNYQSEAVIWEVSIRDFSSSTSSGVNAKNMGKFLAFTEEGTFVDAVDGEMSTCLDYLKNLGVNYVQLNPFFDFDSIDETKVIDNQYNWGYDPKNYNVPEGSYSSNPYDGNVRITECKQMIQALHKAGIGVIMDVVYNHTYESKNSWFNLAVPNYYYRIDEKGNWSNGSGCGNDTASERIMYREFMKNSVMYWADEYHIDGFRFDLMGLHDVTTINYIRESLNTLNDGDKILMYGEGWKLNTYVDSSVKLATQDNANIIYNRVGFFNDTIRDSLAGSNFDKSSLGFVEDGSSKSGVKSGIIGMTQENWADVPNQCVNYVSCHDNLTLYDKLVTKVKKNEDFEIRDEELLSMNKLAAATVLTSQGVPFMLAGEEFGRTKKGDDNSYRSTIDINQIDWSYINKYAELTDYYKGLIQIRKTFGVLTDSSGEVANNIEFINDVDKGVIAYKLANDTMKMLVVLNSSKSEQNINFNEKQPYVQIANSFFAGLENLANIENGQVKVNGQSCAILIDKNTFDSYCSNKNTCCVNVLFKDNTNDSVFYQQLIKGESGSSYSVVTPNDILFNYDVLNDSGNTTGVMKDKLVTVTFNCKPYTGNFGTVTFKYEDKDGKLIANSVIMKNREKQQYFVPYIASINGYSLDLSKLPRNAAGKFKNGNIDVTFKYIPSSEKKKVENLDSKYNSIANVIYLGSNGKILDTKTYYGVNGDPIDIEYKNFDNYQLVQNNAPQILFDKNETNIVLLYQNNENEGSTLLFTVISVFVLCAIFILIFGLIKNKKNHNRDLYIDE